MPGKYPATQKSPSTNQTMRPSKGKTPKGGTVKKPMSLKRGK